MESGRTTRPSSARRCALVTRPRAEAAGVAAALAARGMAALIEPMLDIAYRDRAAPDLAGVQAVLCTSANGVRALARLCGEREVRLFAVGDATAARAQAEGFACIASAGGDVGDLARLVGARLSPAAGPLLHICGSDVAGDLAGQLQARGFAVERAVLYEARPAAALSVAAARALASRSVDVALFFSPRTAAIFARLAIQADVAAAMAGVAAVSLSAAADAALAALPFRTRAVAARPDQPSLLAALDRLVHEGGR
jgi:uroporphyrinogen-III synthase